MVMNGVGWVRDGHEWGRVGEKESGSSEVSSSTTGSGEWRRTRVPSSTRAVVFRRDEGTDDVATGGKSGRT